MENIHKTKDLKRESGGFTLVELIVSFSIFVFIAASIFVRNSEFNSSILLTNLAYDVALSIRQAQVYGVSVRADQPGVTDFSLGYGVHMEGNSPQNYIFFADRNINNLYEPSEMLDVYTIRRGNRIGDFCAKPDTSFENDEVCKSAGSITSLTVSFKRPSADAVIKTSLVNQTYKRARIQLVSPNGSERWVTIESTGQISVIQE
jgi:Tfp pilus assembly protein FimT